MKKQEKLTISIRQLLSQNRKKKTMDLLNGPTEEQLKLIKSELNEDEDRFEHNIKLLKEWISFQEHLPKNYDERILPVFLRGCKHDLERTKRKIELYYSVRKTIPSFYANRDPNAEAYKASTEITAIVPLKNLNKDGCRVTIHKLISSDASAFKIEDTIRLLLMMGDLRITMEHPIAGDIIVIDGGNNLTAAHVARIANTLVGKALSVAHEAYPQRIKNIHIVNMPEIAEKIMILLRNLMKEKMRNRFIIHRNAEELQQYICPEILPKEYGGQSGDIQGLHDDWQKYIQDKSHWFKEQEGVCAVGPIPKHLAQSCALDANESIQGSFRKLAID